MYQLNLPSCHLSIKTEEGKNFVFDILRKKFIVLTPEEWVRQNFVHFLINHYQYPKSLIKLESGVKYNKLQKRSDIIVYDRTGVPFLLVECKSTDVPLTQMVFEQIAIYNQHYKAPYLLITNGIRHICCFVNHETGKFTFLEDIPAFESGINP